MGLIVQKFGGSSVANAEKVFNVASRVIDAYNEGNKVVVVVSAQGDTTDDLIEKAKEINPNPSKREMDMLLSTGEQISISLLAMAIEKLGYPVVSLTGWQIGMKTDSSYGQARIKKIDAERLEMELDKNKSVLEIGVGTGRLAVRIAPLCGKFFGIDISPKTVERAKCNLSSFTNVNVFCGDFLFFDFPAKFDVVYSSLTFMHIKEKDVAINKISRLLNNGGRFVLSIDKNQNEFIDMGVRKIPVFPDSVEDIKKHIDNTGLCLSEIYETEFAYIFIAEKHYD